MDRNTAVDIIDAYGPAKRDWPQDVRDDVSQMAANDNELGAYLKEAREFEEFFEQWDEDDDAVEMDDEPEEQEPIAPIEINCDFMPDMDDMLASVIEKRIKGEWDGKLTIFSRDRDELVDIRVPSGTEVQPLREAVQKQTGVLEKELRRLIAAQQLSRKRPGLRRGRLNSASLHRVMAGDDRVFFRREERPELDTAVTLLIDASGSMRGEKMKLAAQSAFALGQVLHKLGIAFEVIGFTECWERTHATMNDKEWMDEVKKADAIVPVGRFIPLNMPRFKTFDERWTTETQNRFAAVCNAPSKATISMGATPEGCGIDFAARRLLARSEKRKIMMVMTDGQPGASVFNPQSMGMMGNPYVTYSHEMVKACIEAGIDMLGIGIKHDGPTRYYPNSCVVQNISELPAALIKELKKFLLDR